MRAADAARARRHLDERLSRLRTGMDDWLLPPRGWVRAIRDALGMTAVDLGQRLGVTQAAVTQLEKAEKDGSITLNRLRSAAEALDCAVVYALVPRTKLETILRERASTVVDAELARTRRTMALENQELRSEHLEAERRRLIEDALREDPARLWR